MQQRLSLSRAARLVGVARGALQQKIQSGELRAFDGMVSGDDLLRLYPAAMLESDAGFERVTKIREEAFGRRVRERMLPSQEILSQRLFEQSRELTDLRAHLQRYHAMMVQLRERLRDEEERGAGEARTSAARLGELLDRELEAVLGETAAPNALAVMDDMLRVMSAHVVVRPSRHEFFVDGADTILEAALRSGLALNYGCSNGNCGLCKARVVSGQVQKVRNQDYVLSEAEKQQGYTLLCSHTAVGDLVIEALESTEAGDIPPQQIVAQVKAIQALGRGPHAAASADAAQQPPAFSGGTEPDPDGGGRLGATADRELPVRRPQPAFPCRARRRGRFRRSGVLVDQGRQRRHAVRSLG